MDDPAPASTAHSTPPPPPPVPSSDPSLAVAAPQDLFQLPAVDALRLLSASLERLVRATGDVPPTPPPRMPTDPQLSGLQAEKASIVRAARSRVPRPTTPGKRPCDDDDSSGKTKLQALTTTTSTDEIDGVTLKPQPHARRLTTTAASCIVVVGADAQPANLQHGAITRKFYSKNEPPMSVRQYLARLHQFCPMSAAVYLAASLYIHRLAVEERSLPVTRRNAHRLVLAALRVAMKALEDLAYPHAKFARVGGVSETELARLEISFCFLAGFELVVSEEMLRAHCDVLREEGRERRPERKPTTGG